MPKVYYAASAVAQTLCNPGFIELFPSAMSSSLYQDQKNDVMPPDVEDKNATDVTTSDAPDISLASDPNR